MRITQYKHFRTNQARHSEISNKKLSRPTYTSQSKNNSFCQLQVLKNAQSFVQYSQPSQINNSQVPYESVRRYLEQVRKSHIKQKIKNRVKEEMWDIVKKNSEQIQEFMPFEPQEPKSIKINAGLDVFVKGKTFLQTRITSRARNYNSSRVLEEPVKITAVPQTAHESGKKSHRRRVWSSALKINLKDSVSNAQTMTKNSNISESKLEKIDSIQIQPWNIDSQDSHMF